MNDNPLLKIAPNVSLGKDVLITGFVNLYGCRIGDGTMIGPFVEIQSGVVVGSRVKIQSHSFICSGVTIEDEAFIGHGVMFVNDRFPRSTNRDGGPKGSRDWTCTPTLVGRRASIGSNATILCGVTVGEESLVAAGSVVTKDVPARALVAGNPARVVRYFEENDEALA
jgi:UDP-2-acetamido-3-amino-2,3-dideoxy-glucuronate N-acetyltransferase